MKVPQVTGMIIASSEHREDRINKIAPPVSQKDVAAILGDNNDTEFPIYREKAEDDYVKTIATGERRHRIKNDCLPGASVASCWHDTRQVSIRLASMTP